jgi:hypothetical protein
MVMLCEISLMQENLCVFKHMTAVSVLGQDSSQVMIIKSQEFVQQE